MIKFILIALIVLSGFPIGILLSWLCRDELVKGRKWFKVIVISSLVLGVTFIFTKNYPAALTMLFFIIISSVSYWKSFDKKFVKRRI